MQRRRPQHPSGGYVVGNFGISAQIVVADRGPVTFIKINPPTLGVWLQNFACGQLWLRRSGHAKQALQLRLASESRLFPEYKATFTGPSGLRAEVRIFAPLGLDSNTGFLPGLLINVTVSANALWKGEVGYTLRQCNADPSEDDDLTPWAVPTQRVQSGEIAAMIRDTAFVGVDHGHHAEFRSDPHSSEIAVAVPIVVHEKTETDLTFTAGTYSREGHYAPGLPTPAQLITYLLSHHATLSTHLREFVDALPRTGDAAIDRYLRWYASAGILLTKGTRDGNVLTMGYRELNQRDSFWTSGLHLIYWRDLERQMLVETAGGQHASGRIPTTLLPTIDRGDEIDSSEYFVLRVARYFRWYHDDLLLGQLWPSVRHAIQYLCSRDSERVGVPLQQSFWADWKDVPAEQGRQYAPHFALLWLAALRSASELASEMRDGEGEKRYTALADKASGFINRAYADGGLWNGHNYVERWADGLLRPYVLEDQLVGAYFGVIPTGRVMQIYRGIRANETSWGVREKFPYQEDWTNLSGGTVVTTTMAGYGRTLILLMQPVGI